MVNYTVKNDEYILKLTSKKINSISPDTNSEICFYKMYYHITEKLNSNIFLSDSELFSSEYIGVIRTAQKAKQFFSEKKINNSLVDQLISQYDEAHQLLLQF